MSQSAASAAADDTDAAATIASGAMNAWLAYTLRVFSSMSGDWLDRRTSHRDRYSCMDIIKATSV